MLTNVRAHDGASLGHQIKRARLIRGWSLDKLAREVGVSKVSVWSWEHEKTKPRPDTLEQVGKILGLPTGEHATREATSAQSISEVIAHYRSRIARAVGVEMDSVEIKITFGQSMLNHETPING